MKIFVLVAFVLLAGASDAVPIMVDQQPQTIAMRPVWERAFEEPEQIRAVNWATSGQCVAIATTTKVHVVSDSGEQWVWDYARTNRLISIGLTWRVPSSTVAVSPACDVVGVVGNSGYKYVWTADRQGRTAFLNTEGTPSAVKFSIDGDVIAVTTAASVAYVLSPQLRVRWRGRIGDVPLRWQSQRVSVSGGKRWTFLREDIEALCHVVWGLGEDDSVSDDGRWRVAWDWNYRGATEPTSVELWGPDADGYRGRDHEGSLQAQLRWTKPIGCATAEISADGMFVIVTGDQEHPNNSDSDCVDDDKFVYVFDRNGEAISVLPEDRMSQFKDPARWREVVSRAVMNQTGRSLIWQERDRACFDVPALAVRPDEAVTAKMHRAGVCSADHNALLVVTDDHHVQLYRQPK